MTAPPYFDILLEMLERGDEATRLAFGRHVHWGYWEPPSAALGTAADYAEAAERLTDEVLAEARIGDGQSVLDVGCGFGGTLAAINERHREMRLTGINIDDRQLQRARRIVTPASFSGNTLRWVVGDACQLPLPADPAFDVVLAVECVFHFPSRGQFLREAASRLRPGGRLVVSDFVPDPRMASYLGSAGAAQVELSRSYGAVNLLTTESEYRQLAEDAGLEVVVSRDITPQTMPTYEFLRDNLRSWDDKALAADFDRATALLQGACRKGLLAYRVLAMARL